MNSDNIADKNEEEKSRRLYFKTYLQLLRNSVGTEMFKNFYIQTPEGVELDAMSDGSDSCAFYVSAVLTLFGKLSGVHGLVDSTVEDLQQSGWREVGNDDLEAGDVVVWSAVELEGKWYEHIGFYIGYNRAVSTSWKDKKVVEHDVRFDGARSIKSVYRSEWES